MTQNSVMFLPVLLGLILGLALGALFTGMRLRRRKEEETGLLRNSLATLEKEAQALRVGESGKDEALRHWQETCRTTRDDLGEERKKREELQVSESQLKSEVASLSTRLSEMQKSAEEKLSLLKEARESLSLVFRTVAGEILEEKSQRFSQQNQTELALLLDPLRQKLTEFQTRVDDVYVKEGKDRVALAEQVRQLMELNQTLSQEARNLSQALTGSSKTQGNWGELLLEKVLEGSGLRKGEDYTVQESHLREDGTRAQPDVIIQLPEGRHLVVDSKVSLTAYSDFSNASTEADRQAAVKRHLESVRGHLRDLSGKRYQELYSLRSLDFVLMFVPVEPAFMLAVTNDPHLFADAWEKNVLLVSPSTLLFVLRTVAHLWRQEAQSRNAREIAKRGAEFYDRLSAFVADLEKVGERIDQSRDSYREAWNKLCHNKGNLIRQAEMLRELGLKPTRSLPRSALESLASGEESPEHLPDPDDLSGPGKDTARNLPPAPPGTPA